MGIGAPLSAVPAAWITPCVRWAYATYQIVMILITLIWTGEQEEFELGAKREIKSCTRVGGYCRSDVLGLCIEKRDAYC